MRALIVVATLAATAATVVPVPSAVADEYDVATCEGCAQNPGPDLLPNDCGYWTGPPWNRRFVSQWEREWKCTVSHGAATLTQQGIEGIDVSGEVRCSGCGIAKGQERECELSVKVSATDTASTTNTWNVGVEIEKALRVPLIGKAGIKVSGGFERASENSSEVSLEVSTVAKPKAMGCKAEKAIVEKLALKGRAASLTVNQTWKYRYVCKRDGRVLTWGAQRTACRSTTKTLTGQYSISHTKWNIRFVEDRCGADEPLHATCKEPGNCADMMDNDDNGSTDCADNACSSDPACQGRDGGMDGGVSPDAGGGGPDGGGGGPDGGGGGPDGGGGGPDGGGGGPDGGGSGPDGGPRPDGGISPDGGPRPDAGGPDAGPPLDAAVDLDASYAVDAGDGGTDALDAGPHLADAAVYSSFASFNGLGARW